MRLFMSIDMEGMPFIASGEHLYIKGALFSEARRIATRITLWTAEAFHQRGFNEVVIADSHGPMVNLDVESLPEYVTLIRGFPRPLSMVTGVEKADAVVFLGYHSKAGTPKSTFDHTYSSAIIDSLEINGTPASEFLLNTYTAGHFNKPVIMVAGDKALIEEDVARYTPWATRVTLKESYSRFASSSPSLEKIRKELEKAVVEAVERLNKGEAKPLRARYPVEVKVRFLGTEMADVAELLPLIERIDGKTVKYVARDIVEAYRIFELLLAAAPKLYPYSVIPT
ncbi:M55 family metallopeptidase [Desulfurococcus mucosus]|uniref:D-aminopeptidase DppA n=1 Tax=Desulfurococcus mucosus (strain ATCC 35584 / DSM 2162 / JCM 9187 / O7/1) TaxID=765177 RepID=E8R7C4_DESM0|nr:M55 family metallopeptidase [Desulfurococcus mucosus]ADV65589.1 D-aminopeptidase DppA [Desulfurococcus mucosus DSM 2162]